MHLCSLVHPHLDNDVREKRWSVNRLVMIRPIRAHSGVWKCFEAGVRLCKNNCEKFNKGQKVIISTRATSNMLSSNQWNFLVLKPLHIKYLCCKLPTILCNSHHGFWCMFQNLSTPFNPKILPQNNYLIPLFTSASPSKPSLKRGTLHCLIFANSYGKICYICHNLTLEWFKDWKQQFLPTCSSDTSTVGCWGMLALSTSAPLSCQLFSGGGGGGCWPPAPPQSQPPPPGGRRTSAYPWPTLGGP